MLFFTLLPFVTSLIFRAGPNPAQQSAHEVSFTRFFQVFAYSMFVYIPGSILYACAMPWKRLQAVFVVAMSVLSLYYQYKETLAVAKRHLTY
jgi:hypothetical protein